MLLAKRATTYSVGFIFTFLTTNTQCKVVDDPESGSSLSDKTILQSEPSCQEKYTYRRRELVHILLTNSIDVLHKLSGLLVLVAIGDAFQSGIGSEEDLGW